MKCRKAAAPARRISADEAADLVQSHMWIDYGGSISQPDAFDRALARRVGTLENVKIRSVIALRPRAVLEADPDGRSFHFFSWHFGGYDRRMHDAGRCHYIPLHLGEASDYYRRFLAPVDICVLKVAPPDASGRFNLGPTVIWLRALIECSRTVIVEVTPAMPRVEGDAAWLTPGEVDYIIDGDDTPLPELPNPAATDVDRRVAELIAGEIEDGACLQIGIGGMPNAVCSLLAHSGVRDLGIHTEMLTDGIIDLYRAGRITGARKAIDPGQIVYTFALGSGRSYQTLDGNPDFSIRVVEYTNAPQVIQQNEHAVSINNTTQIDLQGQVASESDGHRHISGTGGQLQFVRGAYASPRGKSFICLASTYDKRGERRSRVVFDLTRGNIVTTPRSDVMYVVTEYGIVNLKGKSVPERARALIGLAHPDFREGLERQAYEHRLLPRGLSF
jgi:acyl-CoA hydrolase